MYICIYIYVATLAQGTSDCNTDLNMSSPITSLSHAAALRDAAAAARQVMVEVGKFGNICAVTAVFFDSAVFSEGFWMFQRVAAAARRMMVQAGKLGQMCAAAAVVWEGAATAIELAAAASTTSESESESSPGQPPPSPTAPSLKRSRKQ